MSKTCEFAFLQETDDVLLAAAPARSDFAHRQYPAVVGKGEAFEEQLAS